VQTVLGALREKSNARVAASPGFLLVHEELAMAEKDEEAKSLSLNEAKRRRGRTQTAKIRAEMQKILLVEAARTPPTYYVTLTDVDSADPLPTRKFVRSSSNVAKPGKINSEPDIELREAENILCRLHSRAASACTSRWSRHCNRIYRFPGKAN